MLYHLLLGLKQFVVMPGVIISHCAAVQLLSNVAMQFVAALGC